jgi:glycosyltransferase involved in cell wall biosynthesis
VNRREPHRDRSAREESQREHADDRRKRLLHVTSGLRRGGAETALLRLASSRPMATFTHSVLSLHADIALKQDFALHGIPTRTLGIRAGLDFFRRFPAVVANLAGMSRYDILNGIMYHGCLYATAASLLHPRLPLVWNVRHALDNWQAEKSSMRVLIKLLAKLSMRPHYIIYDSKRCRDQHLDLGYPRENAVVIPNGVDTAEFSPDAKARSEWRRTLGLGPDDLLVGHVARLDPIKAHAVALAAAESLAARDPRAHFVFLGVGEEAEPVAAFRRSSQFNERFSFLGQRADVAKVMPAFDLLWLTSFSESHPNVILEAMSCGVPCVSTDVGDVRDMIREPRWIVRAGDAGALAGSAFEFLQLPEEERKLLGAQARELIVRDYGLEKMANSYAQLYAAVCKQDPESPAGRAPDG